MHKKAASSRSGATNTVAQTTLVFFPAAFEGFFVEKISLFDIYEHSKVGYQAMEISYQKHLLLKFDWFAEDS